MRKIRFSSGLLLSVMLAFSLCACQGGEAASATTDAAESAVVEESKAESAESAEVTAVTEEPKVEEAAATEETAAPEEAAESEEKEASEEAAASEEKEASEEAAASEEKEASEEAAASEEKEATEEAAESEEAAAAEEPVTEESATEESEAEEAEKSEENAENPSATEKLEAENAEPLPLAGVYNLYGGMSEGIFMQSDLMGFDMILTLNEDGTGKLVFNGEELDLTSWTEKDGQLTMEPIGSEFGNITHPYSGVLEFSDGTMSMIFAQENADVSAYDEFAFEMPEEPELNESMVALYVKVFDMNTGLHLLYEYYQEGMDLTQKIESSVKDRKLISVKESSVMGQVVKSADYYEDGILYKLDPETMTGTVTMDYSSMGMDIDEIGNQIQYSESLFGTLYSYAILEDYTEETRDYNGVSCKCEVFQATDLNAEAAFYFDEAGMLVYAELGESPLGGIKGGSSFTIQAIDTEVDEAVFDISGYTIEE